jgi:hypothetical protein
MAKAKNHYTTNELLELVRFQCERTESINNLLRLRNALRAEGGGASTRYCASAWASTMLRSYLINGVLLATILIVSSICGNLAADAIEGRIAKRVAVELRSISQ